LLAFTLSTASAGAQTFEPYPEGTGTSALFASGVTLLDLDQGLGTAPDTFYVDDASDGLLKWDAGSPAQNKVVTFGSFLPGPDNDYGRCKSFRMVFSQPWPAVYFTMWISRAQAGNSIQFEYKASGQSLHIDTVPIPLGTAPFFLRMNPSLSTEFDEIVVSGIGPHEGGAFHGVLDGFLFGVSILWAATCDGGMSPFHAPCPCGNESNTFDSEGCNQSQGYGTRFRLSGNASLSNDTLRFVCMQLPTTGSALFFQGSQLANNGDGVVFGDGLRCASGSIVRLAVKQATNGLAYYPEPGDAPVSQRGQITAVGTEGVYQVWSRNAQSFCTPAAFNMSNGFALTWGN
jgi:hypothetical protein